MSATAPSSVCASVGRQGGNAASQGKGSYRGHESGGAECGARGRGYLQSHCRECFSRQTGSVKERHMFVNFQFYQKTRQRNLRIA